MGTGLRDRIARLRWDPAYRGRPVEIAWYDRVEDRVVRTWLGPADGLCADAFGVGIADEDGRRVTLPYHRIREVRAGDTIVWIKPPDR